jgi:hypothetical protein
MTSKRNDPAEVALVALLDALASVLIELEITPTRLAQIARASFVKIGANQARTRTSGRPHLARIAALTGLSRVEVKRIVSANFSIGEIDLESSPRAVRVLTGWRTSKSYLTRGKPKKLRVTGRAPSFYSLCRAFSGDIPHTVILDELVRHRRVFVAGDGAWVSLIDQRGQWKRNRQEQEALAFAAGFLRDALSPSVRLVRRKQRIFAANGISDTYIENAVAGRVTELLDQMPELFSGKKRSTREIVNVYALVARNDGRKKG